MSRSPLLVTFFLIFAMAESSADIFRMPDITEMPELERKSLLKDLDIPGVRDRDPDPESGPRLNIEKFKLEGIVEFPELGISKADIEKLIEGIRFDLMQEFKVLESGFTQKELEEVSDLLVEIEEKAEQEHVTELEVQQLVWLVREQRSKRGVTLGQIETVADRITQFYRERGFILAKAYIPKQQVRDGIVTLTLLLGELGDVEVVNSNSYSPDLITSTFDDMLGLPVTSAAVEEKLYLINDYPGVITTGFFRPGTQVGDTQMVVNVRDETKFESNVRLDNHGSEQTGQYRLYAEGLINNPLGNADLLKFAALNTIDPDNSTYYQLTYSSRLFSPRLYFGFSASNNDFVLGQGTDAVLNQLGIFGETIQSDVSLSYSFKRSRTASYYGDLIFDEIESQLRLGDVGGADDDSLDDKIENVSLVFRYDVLDEQSRILHQGDVKLVSGQFVKGAELGQDKDYNILNLNYSLLTFWQIPFFDSNTRVIYRASAQLASSNLSTINQFSLAGPTRARAYPSNQFSADNAIYLGVDWLFDAPSFLDVEVGNSNLRQIVQPFLFVDIAWGETIALVDSEDDSTGELSNYGIGLQFSYGNRFNGNLQIAYPIDDKFSDSAVIVEDDGERLVFDFQYSF